MAFIELSIINPTYKITEEHHIYTLYMLLNLSQNSHIHKRHTSRIHKKTEILYYIMMNVILIFFNKESIFHET